MKKLSLTLCAAALALAAGAVPAKRGLRPVTQPDGSVVMIERVGDENHHFTLDPDGNLLTRTKAGFYTYATLDNRGMLVETDSPVQFTAEIADRNHSAIRSLRAPRRVGQIGLAAGTTFPGKGEQRALILLVEFSDKEFTLPDAKEYFTNMLSQEGFSHKTYGGTGSCRDYFIEASMGQFKPEFDVFGPVTLPHTCAYYGGNDAVGQDMRPAQMVIDACDLLDKEIDFSQYDRDHDGWIDNVFVFYAGQGEASYGDEDTIWPHAWGTYFYDQKYHGYDGVYLNSYGCTNEWEEKRPDGIGTFCHEFSHVLGLPDLYNTERTTYVTPGTWNVLDYGPYNNDGRTPPSYSAFERNAMGWIELEELEPDTDLLELPDLRLSNRAFSITNPDNPDEFYLIENRQQDGTDTYLPGHGMIIWHVDYDEETWFYNTVNNTNNHLGVDLIEADGKTTKYQRDCGDAYPGTSRVTKASLKWWDKSPVGIDITGIAETDGTITFSIGGGNGVTPPSSGEDWLSVAEVMSSTDDVDNAVVRGYIVGWISGGNFASGANFNADATVKTNIILAQSADDTEVCIPVQLPYGDIRDGLNLQDNPTHHGKYVELTGTVTRYFATRGLKSVTAYKFLDDSSVSITDVATTPDARPDVIFDLQGRRLDSVGRPGLYIINGTKTLVR